MTTPWVSFVFGTLDQEKLDLSVGRDPKDCRDRRASRTPIIRRQRPRPRR